MNPIEYLRTTKTELDEETAARLSHPVPDLYPVEVRPPKNAQDTPATLTRFAGNIMELQSKWFKFGNASPITTFEIHRSKNGDLRFQYVAPTKRLNRKIRTQLTEEIPRVQFKNGFTGLQVAEHDTIGGAILTVGREDYHPLRTDHNRPPTNAVVSALHRHAMQNTRFIIQIVFQPITGKPIRDWWWRQRAFKQIGYLRKEKPDQFPWHDRPATPQEQNQANQIEEKARTPRYKTSIRILVINAGKYTRSRVKEATAGFNTFEDPVSNQYLNTVTITPVFESTITRFANAIHNRKFDDFSLAFQANSAELAALLALPDNDQENIQYAQP